MLAHTISSAVRPTRIQIVAWVVVVMIILMLGAQLFTYENFATTLAAVLPINESSLTTVCAAMIVLLELFAVPFLLNMKLSRLMRFVSALATVAISVFWFFLMLTNAHVSNSALFGDTFALPGGPIAAFWAAVLFGGVIYVCMWSMRESQPRS